MAKFEINVKNNGPFPSGFYPGIAKNQKSKQQYTWIMNFKNIKTKLKLHSKEWKEMNRNEGLGHERKKSEETWMDMLGKELKWKAITINRN